MGGGQSGQAGGEGVDVDPRASARSARGFGRGNSMGVESSKVSYGSASVRVSGSKLGDLNEGIESNPRLSLSNSVSNLRSGIGGINEDKSGAFV